MNRRTFLQQSSLALALAPLYSLTSGLGRLVGVDAGVDIGVQSIPAAVLNRIGITTVCFRERFSATRSKGAAAPPGGDLTLLTAPKFIADQLGLHNVEVWSAHFAETSLDYCRQIKAAAAAVGSKIINIQVDGPENLSDPDASKRAASIATIKQWMDRATALGAPTMRANTGGGPAAAWDVNRTADSFRQLAEYGKTIGVKILIENHIGYSADIDKVVQLAKTVNDPNCRVISDWGNTPSTSPADQMAGLSKLFPYLELVSAKELDFDDHNHHVSYDIVPLIKATEASGFRGIYSIEFYSNRPPRDVVAAAKDMMQTIAANISRA
jgi:sugar phosphate isomerase/epimerase